MISTRPPLPRLFLVDDDADVLRTLAELLEDRFEVTRLSRFEEARRAIDTTPPDALVTDVRLGAYNGLQLVLHMRTARPSAPIVVLSAFEDTMIRQEAARAGARFLVKPVTRGALLEGLNAGDGT